MPAEENAVINATLIPQATPPVLPIPSRPRYWPMMVTLVLLLWTTLLLGLIQVLFPYTWIGVFMQASWGIGDACSAGVIGWALWNDTPRLLIRAGLCLTYTLTCIGLMALLTAWQDGFLATLAFVGPQFPFDVYLGQLFMQASFWLSLGATIALGGRLARIGIQPRGVAAAETKRVTVKFMFVLTLVFAMSFAAWAVCQQLGWFSEPEDTQWQVVLLILRMMNMMAEPLTIVLIGLSLTTGNWRWVLPTTISCAVCFIGISYAHSYIWALALKQEDTLADVQVESVVMVVQYVLVKLAAFGLLIAAMYFSGWRFVRLTQAKSMRSQDDSPWTEPEANA